MHCFGEKKENLKAWQEIIDFTIKNSLKSFKEIPKKIIINIQLTEDHRVSFGIKEGLSKWLM